MYEISKEFEFCASHRLEGLENGHPCMNTHGHNYKVVLTLQSLELNPNGFVLDYRKFEPFKKHLDSVWDHNHINDIMGGQPSAERIAKFLYQYAETLFSPNVKVKSVSVSETDKTNATYYE